jgi:hypothetical protein
VAACAAVLLWASVAQLVAVSRLLLSGIASDSNPSPPPSALPPPSEWFPGFSRSSVITRTVRISIEQMKMG